MKKLFSLAMLPMMMILASCARDLIPEEVLQLPKNAKLYTAYNLWYEEPEEITGENFLKGKILPFGTEVQIVSMTTKEVVFIAEGTRFRITLKSHQLEYMESFAKKLFKTYTSNELLSGISAVNYEKVRRGVIAKGMTKADVQTAYGPPSKERTPVLENDTWIYQVDNVKSRRVVFRKGRVLEELVLE